MPINAEQLFREIDDLKEICKETRDLVGKQNGRVRRLEQKMAVVWFILVTLGLTMAGAALEALWK